MNCNKVRLILDTDIGCDCDDAGAMAVMHALADRGECEIVAVTHCTSREDGAGCIDAINKYYGRGEITIGTLKDKEFLDNGKHDTFAEVVRQEYPNNYKEGKECEDALKVLRRTLTENEDNSIVIAAIGPLRNMRILLQSKPDEISPMTGKELIKLKVKQFCVMGGYFPKDGFEVWIGETKMDAEFNIYCDVLSAQVVANEWPSEVIFCPYEIGLKIKTGGRLINELDNCNPVRRCYEIYCNGDRESWDPCTVLYAVRGTNNLWNLSDEGKVSFDDKGVSTFIKNENGKHRIILEFEEVKIIEQLIDDLIIKLPERMLH